MLNIDRLSLISFCAQAQSNMEDAYHTDTIPSLREKVRLIDCLFVSFAWRL